MWTEKGKSVVAFLFVLWSVISPLFFGDQHIDRAEWVIIILAVANNVVVYLVPLNPGFKSIKTVAYAIIAAATAAQTLVVDGLQPDDWTIIIGAALAALGVAYAPAISSKQPQPVAVGNGFDG